MYHLSCEKGFNYHDHGDKKMRFEIFCQLFRMYILRDQYHMFATLAVTELTHSLVNSFTAEVTKIPWISNMAAWSHYCAYVSIINTDRWVYNIIARRARDCQICWYPNHKIKYPQKGRVTFNTVNCGNKRVFLRETTTIYKVFIFAHHDCSESLQNKIN